MDWNLVLIIVVVLTLIVGKVLVVAIAFGEGFPWGLAVLFIPFGAPMFVLVHWEKAKGVFLFWVAGATPLLLSSAGATAQIVAYVVLFPIACWKFWTERKNIVFFPKDELDLDSKGNVLGLSGRD